MALGALISLKLAIKDLIKNPYSSISVSPPTQQILEFAYERVLSSEEIARNLLLSSTSHLDLQIKVAASKLLDIIRSLKSKHAPSGSSVRYIEFSAEEVEDLNQDIHSFADLIFQENSRQFNHDDDDDDDDDGDGDGDGDGDDDDDDDVDDDVDVDVVSVSSTIKSKMVGFSDHYKQLKHHLTRPTASISPTVIVLVGMAGIGKTTLATKIFQDSDIVQHYDCRVWLKIGKKCNLKEIPLRILAELNPDHSYDRFLVEGDDDDDRENVIARCLQESLKGKRYLIVLDDVWSKYTACYFKFSSKYRICELNPFPFEGNESRVLLTTRLQQADEHDGHFPDYVLNMRFLNKEESWDLLREKVFDEEELCSFQLEKAGKKIAENCEGLPLMIVTVAGLLAREEKTPQYWNEVASGKNHHLFMDAYDEISKVLYSSYENLSHQLKMCFLYMGVFRRNYEVPRSKLINMWSVDGFLETNAHEFGNAGALECLDELVSNSLVVIYQSNLSPNSAVGEEQIKTCGLHSSLWHLSSREARETKFCHTLSSFDDGVSEGVMQGQCRLSFHNNVLFGIKDVCESVEENCASTARSLLCYGPYHKYQVPICFGLRLLRELDALTVRFYEFPLEVLELVQLRYLALTLNGAGTLPASISQLSNVRFLIVGRHLRIRSCKDPLYMPREIWSMKELKHIEVMGSDLPDPRCASLERLSTLSNVSAHSCTEGVLKAIPKLEKLGIQIELAYDDDHGKLLSCLDQISNLKELRSLKCVMVSCEIVTPLAPLPIFPPNVTKLSLSGLGYPWEEMSKIALLLSLEVLKLRNYAFQGPKWEVKERFRFLHSLVVEDSDLVEWKIGSESLRSLKNLTLKHCYSLEKIEWEHGMWGDRIHWACKETLRKIEVVDCNPLGAEQMNKALPPWKKDALVVHSSWKPPAKK